jgi:hypothetical protein
MGDIIKRVANKSPPKNMHKNIFSCRALQFPVGSFFSLSTIAFFASLFIPAFASSNLKNFFHVGALFFVPFSSYIIRIFIFFFERSYDKS